MINSKKIKELRIKYHLTQTALANNIEASVSTVNRLENNPKDEISVYTIMKVSVYFGVSMTDLVSFEDVTIKFIEDDMA